MQYRVLAYKAAVGSLLDLSGAVTPTGVIPSIDEPGKFFIICLELQIQQETPEESDEEPSSEGESEE